MAEFIYQMYQARKAHGDKVILDDVTLSFYPGAKIGVVGPNGMGKSTLLKIMAGIEEVSNGDARLTPGYTVGILQQEPPLDDDKTVIENVRMAFGDMIAKVDRFNKIGEEMCDPDCDMDALMAEMGKLQDEIDAADGWDIDSKLGQAMDALQLPDSDMPVNVLSGGERRRVLPARAAARPRYLKMQIPGFRFESRGSFLCLHVEPIVAPGAVEAQLLPVDQANPVGARHLAAARARVGVK